MNLRFRTIYAVLSAIILISLPSSVSAQNHAPGLHTIVLDPGHGGKDPGCISSDGKTMEKDIVLSISTRLQTVIEQRHPDVKVYLTRTDDTFVPLIDRPRFASQKNADFFMSIHVNANERSTAVNGYSVHLLGQSTDKNKDTYAYNMDVVKRENDVILLEDDYTTTYEGLDASGTESDILLHLMHNAYREQSLLFGQLVCDDLQAGPFKKGNGIMQNNFAVLRLASMPAMLIELGFMTNPTDLSVLRKSERIDQIVAALAEAFDRYKELYDESVGADSQVRQDSPSAGEKKPEAGSVEKVASAPKAEEKSPEKNAPAATPQNGVIYGTQILATTREMSPADNFFLNYTPTRVNSTKLIRYVIGTSDSLEKAREMNREIHNKFPDSFLVKVENGSCTRVY